MRDDGAAARGRARWAWLRESAALAGVVYAVLANVALLWLVRYPDLATSTDAAAWFGEPGNRARLISGLNVAALSVIAFLWFVAVIRRRLGEREDRFFASVFFGSALIYAAIWLTAASVIAAPAVAVDLLPSGEVGVEGIRLSEGIAGGLLLVVAPRVQSVFMLTTSTLILRTGATSRWIAYFGYVMALTLLFFPFVVRPLYVGFPGWVLVVSVSLLFPSRLDAEQLSVAAPRTPS